MAKNDKDFLLDRNGGREKITRATYNPQGFRRENQGRARSRGWFVWLVLGCVLAAAWRHLM